MAMSKVAGSNFPAADETQEKWFIPSLHGRGKAFVIEPEQREFLNDILDVCEKTFINLCPEYLSELKEFCSTLPGTTVKDFQRNQKRFVKRITRIRMENPYISLAFDNETNVDLICQLAYKMGIPEPEVLNKHYEGFSSEVYGETNFGYFLNLLKHANLAKPSVFLDLGSGVGQVVTFAAGQPLIAKAYGTELAKLPADLAMTQVEFYKKLMTFFGKKHAPLELFNKNILSKDIKRIVRKEANVIFLNNFAFKPCLMRRIIKEVLRYCRNGTKIISSAPLSNIRNNKTKRQLYNGDFAAMSSSELLPQEAGGVSWTNREVQFTLTVVNHEKRKRLMKLKKLEDEARAKKKAQRKAKNAATKKTGKAVSKPVRKQSKSRIMKSRRK